MTGDKKNTETGFDIAGADFAWHYEGRPGSLRRRVAVAVMMGMSILLLSFGIAGYYFVRKNIEDSLNNKIAFGRLIRSNIDNIIKDNINRLYDISISGSVDLSDRDMRPEREALSAAYRYSIFRDGVFLLDKGGNIILNYPERLKDSSINVLSIEPISRMLALGKPVVSNIYNFESTNKKVLFVLVPLKDKNGTYVGVAGGEIDPTNLILTQELQSIKPGKNKWIDIIDSNGIVIASSNPSRSLTQCDHNKFFSAVINARKEHVTTCHQCHVSGARSEKSNNVLVFVPLEMAPWGISILEPEKDVMEPSSKLTKTFAGLGLMFMAIAFVLAIGISRSIVNPIKDLIRATNRIGKGEMAAPIPQQGNDEIGTLSRSFEVMRVKLVESMESIRKYNIELETRVKERTVQIKNSQERVMNLLKRIISTQEDERKRIARGLHDNTLQDLSAALMRIDMCRLHPEKISGDKIDQIRDIILKTSEGVLSVIQNQRPSLLDDLGLEAAIKSLLDMHLGVKGINYFFRIGGVQDKRFRPEVEITLFRIVQEAVVNIARHAGAENVFVIMDVGDETVDMHIEDDGEGFDANSLLLQTVHDTKDGRGLGLLGMKERASLIGGKLQICSSPDNGTRINLRFSPDLTGVENV